MDIKLIRLISFFFIICIILSGCNSTNVVKKDTDKDIIEEILAESPLSVTEDETDIYFSQKNMIYHISKSNKKKEVLCVIDNAYNLKINNMKLYFLSSFIIGIIAGIVIYILKCLVTGMIYLNINNNSFELVFNTLILMGSAFMIIALLYKKPSVLSMIIRFLVFLISFVVIFLEVGGSGLIPFMEKLLKLDPSSASEKCCGTNDGTFFNCCTFDSRDYDYDCRDYGYH